MLSITGATRVAEDQLSESLTEPTDLETDVYGRLHGMLRRAWKRRVSLRLVSLKLSNVYDGRFRSELPLEVSAQRQDACSRLAAVIDELRKTRGNSVILRGHDFLLRNGPRELLADADAKRARTKSQLQIISRPRATDYVPLRCHSYPDFRSGTSIANNPARPARIELTRPHSYTRVIGANS